MGADSIKSEEGCNLTKKVIIIWRTGKRLIEVIPRGNEKEVILSLKMTCENEGGDRGRYLSDW